MKVAVTSEGKTMDSEVCPRFGRAKYFIVVSTEDDSFEVIDNAQNLSAAQGAGVQAAETIVRSEAKCLITGHCGPKAFRVLKAAGIPVVLNAGGTVAENLKKYLKGEIAPAEKPDVSGHWM